MFYLGGSDFPATLDQLAGALMDGLCELFVFPAGTSPVQLQGQELSAISRADIRLTSASARTDQIPPRPQPIGKRQPAGAAKELAIVGQPIRVESAALNLSLTARDTRFDYDRDVSGRPLLLIAEAKEGRVAVDISKRDIDALLLSAARKSAQQQGVQVVETNLTLNQPEPRTIAVEARVKAKKLFVTAVVTIRGRASINQELAATLSNLSCTGEGMLGSMACGVLQPKLDQYNNRTFPLTALALGEIRLSDVNVSVGDTIRVTASFGSSSV